MATGTPKSKKKEHDASLLTLQYEGKVDAEKILKTPVSSVVLKWGKENSPNKLLYGENLGLLSMLATDSEILGKVKLVYIDPPFATQAQYHSRKLRHAYEDLLRGGSFVEFLRARLILLHKLLAYDGALYLHLDEKMVFPMKLVLDEIFGEENYRNCITRKKCNSKNFTSKQYGNIADYLLFYTKTKDYVWNRPTEPWTEDRAVEYRYVDQKTGRRYMKVPIHAPGVRHGETGEPWRGVLPPPGKHWQFPPKVLEEMDKRGEIFWSSNNNPRRKVFLDESAGIGVQDIWLGFRDAHNQNIHITGYPTEKNIELLKRIIKASSNPGDLVLDCFAGSGTTLVTASELSRRWIGIDKSQEAIRTSLNRFANGTDRMGDYVTKSPPRTLDLFGSLSSDSPVRHGSHKPIIDFALFMEKSYVTESAAVMHEWQETIGHFSCSNLPLLDSFNEEVDALRSRDPLLAKIINNIGPCKLAPHEDPFSALVDAIISQQLSKKAADTIKDRVKALFRSGRPNAEELLRLSTARMRAAGVSSPKINYLRDLAKQSMSGCLDIALLRDLPDEDVINRLMAIKGIGRWTAEMFLIFTLNRKDIFPASDLALLGVIRNVYNLSKGCDPAELLRICDRWRPYRSVACWYLYSHINIKHNHTLGLTQQQKIKSIGSRANSPRLAQPPAEN